MIATNKKIMLDIFLLILVSTFVYRGWFMPGILHHGDWLYYTKEKLLNYIEWPYLWESSLKGGYYSIIEIPLYPILKIEALLAEMGVDFSISGRLFFFWPFVILKPILMYFFAYFLFKNRIVSFFSTLLFCFNPYILIISTGHLTVGMAYTLSPLFLLSFLKLFESTQLKLKYILFSALCSFLIFLYDLRILFINFLILILFLLFNFRNKNFFLKNLLKILISIFLFFLLSSYFFIPSIVISPPKLPESYTKTVMTELKIYNAFFGILPQWIKSELYSYLNNSPTSILFFLFPLAFLVLLFCKEKKILLFAIISLIGIFLVKGTQIPFGEIYYFLFRNVPGFFMFREPSKFFLMVFIGMSILWGKFIEFLSRKYNKKILLTCFFLIFMLPVYPFVFNIPERSLLKPVQISQDFLKLKHYLLENSKGYHTFFLPSYPFLRFDTQDAPHISKHAFFDKLRYYFYIDKPSTSLIFKEKYIAPIFGLFNIKYVVFLRDPEILFFSGGLPLNEYESLLNFQGLNETIRFGNFSVYQINNASNDLFLAKNPIYVVGDLESLIKLSSKLNISLRNKLFFFNTINSFFEFNNSKYVVFDGKDINELLFSIYPEFSLKSNFSIISIDPNFDLESPELTFERNKKIVDITVLFVPNNKTFLRAIFSNESYLIFNNKLHSLDSTHKKFVWFDTDVIQCNSSCNLTFKNVEIDKIVSLNRSLYFKLINSTINALKHKKILIFGNENIFSNTTLSLSFKKYNNISYYSNFNITFLQKEENSKIFYIKKDQTRYFINTSETSSPCFIVFSRNYDPHWCINESCSLKGNLILNAIYLDKCAQKNLVLRYLPQDVMDISFFISTLSFFVILIVLITIFVKEKF